MDIRIGDVIPGATENDRYTIKDVLGSGAFGVVFRAEAVDGNSVAIKTISTAALDDTALRALINEGKHIIQVCHQNVLAVKYFHDGNTHPHFPPYIVMEYADGGTLADLLRQRTASQQYFSIQELLPLFRQLADGMKAINNVVVHRDIKPDNILVSEGILRISDFGLSKLVAAATRSDTFKGINHIRYCAPEAWRQQKNSPAMDIYSMGIVFYELGCLRQPYDVNPGGDLVENWREAHLTQQAHDPREYNSAISLWLSQVILKMIAKRLQDRYQSWDEVLEALTREESQDSDGIDISHIVERAIRRHHTLEANRLQAEAEQKRRREYESTIIYSFQEILEAAQATIDAFNKTSEYSELYFVKKDSLSFAIAAKGIPRQEVVSEVRPVHDDHYVYEQKVKAWGYVRSQSGRGFNLILTLHNQDDLYGSWITFHVTHSVSPRRRDNRPEPFYFEHEELPREIQHLRAIHVYQTQKEPFRRNHLDPLIAEIFDSGT